MEKKPTRPMTPFDEKTIPDELQMMKLLLPYTPASGRRALAVFVKFIEFKQTMYFLNQPADSLQSQGFRPSPPPFLEILEEISPYLPPRIASLLDTLRNMMHIMEMIQMFQETADFSKQGEEASSENSGGFDPQDLMMGMLSPEQKEMFEMYQTMFTANSTDTDSVSENTDNSEPEITDSPEPKVSETGQKIEE